MIIKTLKTLYVFSLCFTYNLHLDDIICLGPYNFVFILRMSFTLTKKNVINYKGYYTCYITNDAGVTKDADAESYHLSHHRKLRYIFFALEYT